MENGESLPQSYVALVPGDFEKAKHGMLAWCAGKQRDLRLHKRELTENFNIAQKNKWRISGLRSAIAKVQKEIDYYGKIKAATEAGYLIIPEFPVEVFAVRVNRSFPIGHPENNNYVSTHTQHASGLALDRGHYVSPDPLLESEEIQRDNKTVKQWRAVEFQDVMFPVARARAVILNKTQEAMALKIFDEFGLVGSIRRKGDPILVGRIMRPESTSWNRRYVNFFIAGWLDYSTL